MGMRWLLCFVVLAGCVGVCWGQGSGAEWREFAPKGGGFKALFPGKPKESERVLKAGELPLRAHEFRAGDRSAGGGEYALMYFDVPVARGDEGAAKEVLDGARGLALEELGGGLVGEKEIRVEGLAGRELEVSRGQGGFARVMLLLAGSRLYRLSAAMQGAAAGAQGGAERFFESFRLLPIDRSQLGEVDRYLLQDPKAAEGTLRPESRIVNGGFLNRKAVSLPKPEYPMTAMRERESGTVDVKIIVDEQGQVVAAQVESGPAVFQAACLKAARGARFTPTSAGGKPARVLGFVTYKFYAQ